jgi:nitronate monooxygenase
VAVIRNAYIERLGTKAGAFARWMLEGRRTKHWMRAWYTLSSVRRLKRSLLTDDTSTEYWQAGKSVAGIHEIKPAAQIVREFAAAVD